LPVTSIGDEVFGSCTNLAIVTFAKGSQLTSIYGEAFRDCTSLASINIPAGVKFIGDEAFGRCTRLTSVTFEGNAIIVMKADAFPSGFNLWKAYRAGGAGTYTRTTGGSDWTKQ